MTEAEKIVHQILYTRYTMVSAGMSIIPEMMEKIELDGTTKYFKTTKTDIVNKMTKSRIMFRVLKPFREPDCEIEIYSRYYHFLSVMKQRNGRMKKSSTR